MKISIIYYSNTGNTHKIADAIRYELKDQDIVYFGEPPHMPIDSDLYIVGSCISNGNCVEQISDFIKKLENKKIAYFATAGFGMSKDYFASLKQRFIETMPNHAKIIDYFYCPGKMPPSVRDDYIKQLATNPGGEKMKVLINNFDKVKDRPNKDDISGAKLWARKVVTEVASMRF